MNKNQELMANAAAAFAGGFGGVGVAASGAGETQMPSLPQEDSVSSITTTRQASTQLQRRGSLSDRFTQLTRWGSNRGDSTGDSGGAIGELQHSSSMGGGGFSSRFSLSFKNRSRRVLAENTSGTEMPLSVTTTLSAPDVGQPVLLDERAIFIRLFDSSPRYLPIYHLWPLLTQLPPPLGPYGCYLAEKKKKHQQKPQRLRKGQVLAYIRSLELPVNRYEYVYYQDVLQAVVRRAYELKAEVPPDMRLMTKTKRKFFAHEWYAAAMLQSVWRGRLLRKRLSHEHKLLSTTKRFSSRGHHHHDGEEEATAGSGGIEGGRPLSPIVDNSRRSSVMSPPHSPRVSSYRGGAGLLVEEQGITDSTGQGLRAGVNMNSPMHQSQQRQNIDVSGGEAERRSRDAFSAAELGLRFLEQPSLDSEVNDCTQPPSSPKPMIITTASNILSDEALQREGAAVDMEQHLEQLLDDAAGLDEALLALAGGCPGRDSLCEQESDFIESGEYADEEEAGDERYYYRRSYNHRDLDNNDFRLESKVDEVEVYGGEIPSVVRTSWAADDYPARDDHDNDGGHPVEANDSDIGNHLTCSTFDEAK